MKIIYRYIFIAFLSVAVFSCKKDWFDVTATNQIKAEDQFSSVDGFKDALMGVYIGMTRPALYSKDMTWNLVDLLSRQYETLPTLALYSDVQQFKYETPRASNEIDAIWKNQYNVIANVNGALDEIDNGVLQGIQHDIIKGELLALRAFLHFDLLRLYGRYNYANSPELAGKPAIPYALKLSKDLVPQESYERTFELMKKDIQDAMELLKQDPVYKDIQRPDNYYQEVNLDGFYDHRELRMNYYATEALLVRVYLWQGGSENLAKAATAAEDVINNSMSRLRDPSSSVGPDRILSQENLFRLNVTGFANILGQFFNAEQTTNYDALLILRPNAESLYETNNQNIGAADIRFNTLLTAQSRGMVSTKLILSQTTAVRDIMPLIKLPEMYYAVVEANIQTDPTKAIEYLNEVRQSRGILEMIPADADEQVIQDELTKEYRKEFISEGQLFFYYKRTGVKQIPGLAAGSIADDKIYMLPYPDNEIEFGNRIQ